MSYSVNSDTKIATYNGVATTSLRQRTRDSSNSALDLDHTTCTIHGDLA